MQSGQIIAGKYRLNQLLGSGGMATVWSATNTFTEREFAIKFLNPGAAKNAEAATRFLNEAKVTARINHPNIIDILDVGQTEAGNLFLVMELLTGVPLEVALRRQHPPMSLHEFAFVMVEVARALAAAHRSGVIHRDLKPSNIFLHKDKSGAAQPKLLDFGVSKFLEQTEANHALTVAGTVLGSPLYMSPEQARGDGQIDGRTDVFAFGVILFEALTGIRPFEGLNFNQLIVNIATKPPRSVDFHAPHMPPSLRAIVHTCLEPDKARRTVTFEVIAERLYNLLPELEACPFRLPPQQTTLSTHDPDATHALPVVRPSDRPPPQDPALQGGTPSPSYASISLTQQARLNPRSVVLVGAGVAVVLVGALLGVVLSVALRARRAEAVTTEPVEAPVTTPPAPTGTSHEPPVVAFDSLPPQKAAAPKPVGRLLVTAAPGWCTVSVDGVVKGPTPLPVLELPAGAHHLECQPPDRRAKIKHASVTLEDGQTSRFAFPVDP